MTTSINGHIKIHDLVFSLTRQCNAFCDFCCNDDGPLKKGVIDPEYAKQWIKDFVEYVPYCRTAGFTGGEVFLRYQEMEKIHEYLHEYDFKTSITTNGFWGQNPDRARVQLKRLMELGLKEIAVSIDPSHIEWVPLKHSTAAVKIALECGLTVAVTSHFKSGEGSAKDYFEPEYHPHIIWDESHYVLPVGRAKQLPKESFKSSSLEHLFCPRVQMVIQPNGDVDPCCSVCLDDGVFVVGNLYRQTMPEVLVNMLSDMYLKIITHRGLDELEKIVQRYHPTYFLPKREYSVCYMCNNLRQQDNFWMVKDAMQKYTNELLIENLQKIKGDIYAC
ncbi:radical SAM/SPASM domain-containing protein [Bacillus sp. 165]|uniref:radical SAM/SPASM domain-containing protein n=1 Tax=Bacillus sp. 165 TaxID=1529117 RepID=UPI001ADB09E1|nr:radical SAM/SPASM domain-containing protein [Bacillus sp. 165]MBO9129015.1 radical SAM protein [Bacillus sp. 165]